MENVHRKQAYAELNYAQRQVYLAIKKYIRDNGYSPTYRELCELTNYSSVSTVSKYIDVLVKLDLITAEEGKPRTIKVLPFLKG
ncbi:MAG TPA: helix-turn-helix domain-containing protein [Patescibacteria group bacterium]|nr:helix-turn-helix domain-containing protein [Patescibacteria group bacterium]